MSEAAWRWLVAAGLAVVFGLSVVLTAGGGLQWDDFGNLRFSRETDVLDFLLTPVSDHLAPGHRALTLLQYALGPANTAAMHVVMSGIQTLALAGFIAVSRHLYGRRPWIVLLAVLVSVSTTFIATQLWFAASLHQLPALAAGLWSIVFFLRYRENGAGRELLVSVLLIVVGLTFISKVLLLIGVIYLLDQFLLRPTKLTHIPARTTDEWPLWLGYALPVAVYLVVAAGVVSPAGRFSSARSIVVGIRDGWLERFVPLLVGWDPAGSSADRTTQLTAVVFLQVLLAAAVYASVRRRRDSLRAVAIVLAVLVLNGVMTLVLRVDAFGPDVPMIHRYWLEPLVIAALLLPWGFAQPADPDAPRSLRGPPSPFTAAVAGGLVLAVVGGLSAWSAWRLVDGQTAFRARAWLEDVRAAVASAEEPPSILDDLTPVAWTPVWTLEDLAFLLTDARFTDDPDALMVAGDRLIEPDFRPLFDLDGADLLTNTLTSIAGDVESRGTALCTSTDTAIEMVLAPSDVRRYARATIRGPGTVWFVPRDQGGEDQPARELHHDRAASDLLFPMDRWPLASFQLRMWPTPDAGGLCLESLAVGIIANAPDIPDHGAS
jgi:hypothetical protein